jgi:cellulose synthase/poly-beta-1,6-N-acetylglucosamine synthase-like glycosyltransferase
MTLEEFITLICIFYLFQLITYSIGVFKSYNEKTYNFTPKVSIIIAARNEEANIGNCLLSLSKVDYPKDKIEIIIVNDHSEDSTQEIIDKHKNLFSNFQSIVPEIRGRHLIGKTNAIAQGIEVSSGEIIITSDADCIFKTSWIKDIVKYYDDKTGIVCGFTYVEHKNIFEGMQSLDWVYLLTVASGSFGLKIPLACVGNNMSFRRKAYDEVGGYQKLKFSITEDFALLQGIVKTKKWKCKYPFETGNLALSKACTTYKEIFRQKKRWGMGGKKAPFIGFILMTAGFLISGLSIAAPFLPTSLFYKTLIITTKFGLDFLFLIFSMKKFKLFGLYKYFLIFEIYYTTYVVLLPFMVFINQKVEWKGRVYKG